jgi:hypothetical protein
MAFIALTQGEIVPVTRERSPGAIVGVARLIESEPGIAEVATVISDAFPVSRNRRFADAPLGRFR